MIDKTCNVLITFALVVPLLLLFGKWHNGLLNEHEQILQNHYLVEYHLSYQHHLDSAFVKCYVPKSTSSRQVGYLQQIGIKTNSFGSYAVLNCPPDSFVQEHRLQFIVKNKKQVYNIPKDLSLLEVQTDGQWLPQYVDEEQFIQSDHPEVIALASNLASSQSISEILHSIYSYIHENLQGNGTGLMDAVSSLRGKSASCVGYSRLFVALCRSLSVPSRIAGGLILHPGLKKTSHVWAEVLINDHWVPFDPLNQYFAELPAHYLPLYNDDQAIISHSSNINFDYQFGVQYVNAGYGSTVNWLSKINLFFLLPRFSGSIQWLQILLLFPFAAFVIALLKNVIGLKPLGIFFPAIISASLIYVPLLPGISMIILILATIIFLNFFLEKLQLLYFPKMVILLAVSIAMIFAVQGLFFEVSPYDQEIIYIPVIVTLLIAEKLTQKLRSDGIKETGISLWHSLITIFSTWIIFQSQGLFWVIVAQPEILLILVALLLLLGRWVGIRSMEYLRFKTIL